MLFLFLFAPLLSNHSLYVLFFREAYNSNQLKDAYLNFCTASWCKLARRYQEEAGGHHMFFLLLFLNHRADLNHLLNLALGDMISLRAVCGIFICATENQEFTECLGIDQAGYCLKTWSHLLCHSNTFLEDCWLSLEHSSTSP